MTTATLRIAAIPGDGIGPEVVTATLPALEDAAAQSGAKLAIERLDWSAERSLSQGSPMPADGIEIIRDFDAVLFGAVGRPDVADEAAIWGLILALRHGLDLHVNIRPVRTVRGVPTPLRTSEGADFVCIRENTEGEYSGIGGIAHSGTAAEIATEVAIHSRRAIHRVASFAFALARERAGSVQAVTKSNVMRYGYVLWDDVVRNVGKGYPDVPQEFVLVDAMAARIVERPASLSVLLASNLFGDILSDLASTVAGGLGTAPSANVNPEGGVPGVFEPVHGSAPDIAGTGRANPVACLLSAAMLLEWNGLRDAGKRLREAVEAVLRMPSRRTPDLAGQATTQEFADEVRRQLSAVART